MGEHEETVRVQCGSFNPLILSESNLSLSELAQLFLIFNLNFD